jgi:hypothetical protein
MEGKSKIIALGSQRLAPVLYGFKIIPKVNQKDLH